MKTLLVNLSKAAGAVHFVSQTVADAALNCEGNLAVKLGNDKSEAMSWRVARTDARQDAVLAFITKTRVESTETLTENK